MNKTGMFGNFDVLVPSGYTIFTYFTDYETKLHIVAIVPEDYKKLSPIPSKKYIIDPWIPKILLVDEQEVDIDPDFVI